MWQVGTGASLPSRPKRRVVIQTMALLAADLEIVAKRTTRDWPARAGFKFVNSGCRHYEIVPGARHAFAAQ